MKLSAKDKRFVACTMNIEALAEVALEDIATALPFKKQSSSITEWELVQETIQDIRSKIELVTTMITEETKPEYINSAINMSYDILRQAELVQEKEEA